MGSHLYLVLWLCRRRIRWTGRIRRSRLSSTGVVVLRVGMLHREVLLFSLLLLLLQTDLLLLEVLRQGDSLSVHAGV